MFVIFHFIIIIHVNMCEQNTWVCMGIDDTRVCVCVCVFACVSLLSSASTVRYLNNVNMKKVCKQLENPKAVGGVIRFLPV